MITSFDLSAIQPGVEGDLPGLEMYLQQLVGEPFLFFRESYGQELTVHFGALTQRKSSKLKDPMRGAYVLTVRGSMWMIVAAEEKALILSDLPKYFSESGLKSLVAADIEKSPPVRPGSRLVWIAPHRDDASGGIGLMMAFSDRTRFFIRPEPQGDDANGDEVNVDEVKAPTDIADWELYTPIGRYLRVGPGQNWAYLSTTE